MVHGLQITMFVDGRSVTFNFVRQENVDELFREPGTLGSFLRGLRDASDRVRQAGQTTQVTVGAAGVVGVSMGDDKGRA